VSDAVRRLCSGGRCTVGGHVSPRGSLLAGPDVKLCQQGLILVLGGGVGCQFSATVDAALAAQVVGGRFGAEPLAGKAAAHGCKISEPVVIAENSGLLREWHLVKGAAFFGGCGRIGHVRGFQIRDRARGSVFFEWWPRAPEPRALVGGGSVGSLGGCAGVADFFGVVARDAEGQVPRDKSVCFDIGSGQFVGAADPVLDRFHLREPACGDAVCRDAPAGAVAFGGVRVGKSDFATLCVSGLVGDRAGLCVGGEFDDGFEKFAQLGYIGHWKTHTLKKGGRGRVGRTPASCTTQTGGRVVGSVRSGNQGRGAGDAGFGDVGARA
jgi:hypothetical protein